MTGSTVLLMEPVGCVNVTWTYLTAANTIQQITGLTVSAHLERGGSRYVLDVSGPSKAAKLRQVTVLSNAVDVRICSHPFFYQVRFVISREEIVNVVSERVLRRQFAPQGIVAAIRICKVNGGEKKRHYLGNIHVR